MERYIGVLKGLVTLMSDMDGNLAQRALMKEQLNYLPQQESLYTTASTPKWDAPFPFAPTNSLFSSKKGTPTIIEALKRRFPDDTGEFPISVKKVKLTTKFHLRWKTSIGCANSHNIARRNRRDDSYIWWNSPDGRRFGQVVIFAQAYTWEEGLIVKPWPLRSVKHNRGLDTWVASGNVGAMEHLLVTQIGGLVGRIEATATSWYLVARFSDSVI